MHRGHFGIENFNRPEGYIVYKYFKIEEFASPDDPTSGNMMDSLLLDKLDLARDICGFPLIINSGYRSIEHNKKVGGVANSSHLLGLAVDIHCTDSRKRFMLLDALLVAGFDRVGLAATYIHVDVDPEKKPCVIWTY
jgi:zinc D-Ala-D-Ala carboxypeptidase